MADGIDDGIPAEVVFGCPLFVMFERKRALNLRCSLSKARNCRLEFTVWLTVSLLSDWVERPSSQGSRSPIDNRVGMTHDWSKGRNDRVPKSDGLSFPLTRPSTSWPSRSV